ncbi:hypothetical protein TNCV_630001 [Trichonephila clavipes]|nr:hypothetical protein TNCV_630001 [Trichonephila clavipes]
MVAHSSSALIEFELSATEGPRPSCQGNGLVTDVSSPPFGVVSKLGERIPAQVSSSSWFKTTRFLPLIFNENMPCNTVEAVTMTEEK